jgi:hypothetical protein
VTEHEISLYWDNIVNSWTMICVTHPSGDFPENLPNDNWSGSIEELGEHADSHIEFWEKRT